VQLSSIDIMRRDVVTVRKDETCAAAAQRVILLRRRWGRLRG
jgi:CBS-domain-containing membrane protein